MLIGDNIRYVGPDNVITLRCTFGASNAIRSVVWLRNGVDITTVSSSGYTITASPTTFSELVFSAFDRTNHVGSYQCMVTGQLGNLRSKAVSVLSAGVCGCVSTYMYICVNESVCGVCVGVLLCRV